MARTKQTSRKSVAQKVPRKQPMQNKKSKSKAAVEIKVKRRIRFKPGTVALR